ncbi:MAG: hypothetical protein ACFFAO_16980 [Candidatus Hermodarchaeota archaeon]
MAEMSKELKIVVLINSIIALIYGFLFVVLTDIYLDLSDEAYPNPHLLRLWGGTILILAIFGFIIIKRAEWEQIKIFWEFVIIWLIMIVLVGFWSFAYIRRSATAMATAWIDIIVCLVMAIVDIFFYQREQKA